MLEEGTSVSPDETPIEAKETSEPASPVESTSDLEPEREDSSDQIDEVIDETTESEYPEIQEEESDEIKNEENCKKSQRERRSREGKESGKRRRRRASSGSGSSSSIGGHGNIPPERLRHLKEIVDKAAQHHKTFTILGRYPAIKDALKSRGWIQNFDLHKLTTPKFRHFDDDVKVLARLQSSDETERLIISRLLRHTPVSFLWATSENIDWNSLSKNTLVSRFPRVYFTTKVGICNYLQQSHWFCETGISGIMFPRCYNISSSDDLDAFIKDFRLTSCQGLLKKLVTSVDNGDEMFDECGKIPIKVIEFAVKRCWELVATQEHEDIDKDTEEKVWDHQWDQFLTHYYQFVHENQKLASATPTEIHEVYLCAKTALKSVEPFWPQMNMDGTHNLWIVKPGAKSRGRGILVFNKLEDIVSRVGGFNNNEVRFVVQKYIERPLLIYNTKFDIRQWFLVTSVYPLTIWMYRESYLRFCSQLFSLSNMHESVHLSNNAIQCKYRNNHKRDRALPEENMWDCYTFKTYLKTLGLSDRWESVVYAGMKESITGALLAAQEHMEHRRNCFELYGADFMLTDDLVPWLIEINSSPCMAPTTSVTARMCAQCLEDAIKVVIDKRNDKDADTGMFELVYKQQVSNPQPYMGMNLTVKGSRIIKSGFTRTRSSSKAKSSESESAPNSGRTKRIPMPIRDDKDTVETPCSSSGVSSGTSDSEFGSMDSRKRTYKRHCCVRRTSISQAVAMYKSRNYEEIARRLRMQSNHVRYKTVRLPETAELFDWKKRVEQTRADCKRVFLRLSEAKRIPSPAIRAANFDKEILGTKLPEITKTSPKREINNNDIVQVVSKLNELVTHTVPNIAAVV